MHAHHHIAITVAVRLIDSPYTLHCYLTVVCSIARNTRQLPPPQRSDYSITTVGAAPSFPLSSARSSINRSIVIERQPTRRSVDRVCAAAGIMSSFSKHFPAAMHAVSCRSAFHPAGSCWYAALNNFTKPLPTCAKFFAPIFCVSAHCVATRPKSGNLNINLWCGACVFVRVHECVVCFTRVLQPGQLRASVRVDYAV